jgi:EthD domain
MVNYFTFITAGAGQDSAALRQWFLQEHAPAMLRHCPRLLHLVVNLREQAHRIDNGPALAEAEGPRRRYQAVIQMSFEAAEEFTDRARLYDSKAAGQEIEDALRARVGEAFTYRVTDVVEKDAHPRKVGERSGGTKMLSIAGLKKGLTSEEWQLGWEVHGPLALRTHVGLSRYVRNVIEESLTPGAPDYRGIAELQFLSVEDAVRRFFPTPHAARIIEFDTARWMASYEAAYFSEYVLK